MSNETTMAKASLPALPIAETIEGVRCYIDREGTAWLKLEDVAIGLEFTRVAKSGNVVIRWERVRQYLIEVRACPETGHGIAEQFIPENIFFRLIWKSRSKGARAFQDKVTDVILPTLRKTGSYHMHNAPQAENIRLSSAIAELGVAADQIESIFGVNRGIALSKATALVEDTYNLNLGSVKDLLPAAQGDVGRLTPTDIGNQIGYSARDVNAMLCGLALQQRTPSKAYVLTDAGKQFGEMIPFTRHGHSGYRILWKPTVVDQLLYLLTADDAR